MSNTSHDLRSGTVDIHPEDGGLIAGVGTFRALDENLLSFEPVSNTAKIAMGLTKFKKVIDKLPEDMKVCCDLRAIEKVSEIKLLSAAFKLAHMIDDGDALKAVFIVSQKIYDQLQDTETLAAFGAFRNEIKNAAKTTVAGSFDALGATDVLERIGGEGLIHLENMPQVIESIMREFAPKDVEADQKPAKDHARRATTSFSAASGPTSNRQGAQRPVKITYQSPIYQTHQIDGITVISGLSIAEGEEINDSITVVNPADVISEHTESPKRIVLDLSQIKQLADTDLAPIISFQKALKTTVPSPVVICPEGSAAYERLNKLHMGKLFTFVSDLEEAKKQLS